MKKVKGLSRIFNVLAYAFLVLAVAGYAKFKFVNGNGSMFSIFAVVFEQLTGLLNGKVTAGAIVIVLVGVLLVAHFALWFVFNVKRDTKYYTAAIHLSVVAALGTLVGLKWNVLASRLTSAPKTTLGIIICLCGYALCAILAVVFSYIVTVKQVKYEKELAENAVETIDRTPELEAQIRDNQAEIAALKDRVAELEARPVAVAPVEEPVAEEPVVEEVVEEPVTEEPAVEETTDEVVEEVAGKKVVIRRSFDEKFLTASEEIMTNYNILRNELVSYGVKSRLSHSCDTYRAKREEYAKITIVGKNLKLYLALDPKEFENSTIPVRDVSAKNCFKSVPAMIRIKSPLSLKRAKMLIADMMDRRGLKQGEVGTTDFASEIKKAAEEEANKAE